MKLTTLALATSALLAIGTPAFAGPNDAAPAAQSATTANPNPSTTDKAAARVGNEVDQASTVQKPVTRAELRSAVSLDGIDNPQQSLATAELKNRQGDALGSIKKIDVGTNGSAATIHADVGGFLGVGEKVVSIPASDFVYLKSRNLLVTRMTKDEIKALPADAPNGT